jgi:hypothetical protein
MTAEPSPIFSFGFAQDRTFGCHLSKERISNIEKGITNNEVEIAKEAKPSPSFAYGCHPAVAYSLPYSAPQTAPISLILRPKQKILKSR